MNLGSDSRVAIVREQALLQGAKFPGAFAYTCDVEIDGRSVGKVRQTKASTARSVGYRAVESLTSSRSPDAAPRVYQVACTIAGERKFTLEKPERLSAPVWVADARDSVVGRLDPVAGVGPRFVLRDGNERLLLRAEPLSARGLDFDFLDEGGTPIAALRLDRKSVARTGGRLAVRAAAVTASYGLGDMMGKDRFSLTFTGEADPTLHWLTVACAVACSAERGAGQAVGQVANATSRALGAARTAASRRARAD